MPGDYSRFSFDALEDHFAVLMQQGRVMLDADHNEGAEVALRQFRVRMLDTVGRCVVPRETLEGFQIQIAGNSITIGLGRAYVHGLLAENHGVNNQGRPVTKIDADALEYDPILEERRGTLSTPYGSQPYLPNAEELFPIPDQVPFLVYLDVWQREVTHVQEDDLVEKAVGVDTATRVQVVWQVKVLPVPPGTTCATPDDAIPGWPERTAPPAGRLTTNAVGVPASDDPCIIGADGGFRGTENRLYRVEVHEGGPADEATFKWSRDNASVKTRVLGINGGRDELTVSRIGRDAVQRFARNDWIEVIDDHLELVQAPGVLIKVLTVDDVNETITLDGALPANVFNEANPAERNTRIRRWDQKGQVLDSANAIIDNVDANGGVIRVSAGGGTMVLEDGVEVTFTEDPAGGMYRTGDYWVFAARTVDSSVEELVQAPPKGIIHHYCRLAIATLPNQIDDCRIFWPPEFGEQGCDCTECVTAESHNSGEFTIQSAIDRVRAVGGKVCLGPGTFNLGNTPVLISGAQSIQIQGHGWRTNLLYNGNGAAVSVTGSIGVDISSLSIAALAAGDSPTVALFLQNSAMVRVEECLLAQLGGEERGGPAVGLNGVLVEVALRDNIMFGAAGVASFAAGIDADPTTTIANLPSRNYTFTIGLAIDNNFIVGTRRGISLDRLTLHAGDTRISDNRIFSGPEVGVITAGVVHPLLTSSRVDIRSNDITAQGTGIAFATDNTRVIENDIGVFKSATDVQIPRASLGIVLTGGQFDQRIDRAQVLSNRITGMSRDAIRIQTPVGSAMIKQNIIEGTGGGIVMDEKSTAELLSIENNHLLNVGTTERIPVFGIRVLQAEQVAIAGNLIDSFAVTAVGSPRRVAIELVGSNAVRVDGNDLRRIGPPGGFVGICTGIEVWVPFDRVDVLNNSVRRNTVRADQDNSIWNGIVIRHPIIVEGPSDFTADIPGRAVFFPLTANVNDRNFLLVAIDRLVIMAAGTEIAGARGNFVDGYGNGVAARMLIRGAAVFSDNRADYTISQQITSEVADVNAESAIVSGNHIQRRPDSDNQAVLDIATPRNRATVLGNICIGGRIILHGIPLADPWKPLNVANT